MQKVFRLTLLLFASIVLFCYVAWHMGYDGLRLPYIPELNTPLLHNSLCIILYSFNFYLTFVYCSRDYSVRAIKITLIITLAHTFAILSSLPQIWQILGTTVFTLAMSSIQVGFKKALLYYGQIVGAGGIYQLTVTQLKLGTTIPGAMQSSANQMLMYSIDVLLLYLVFYCIGGERHYVEHSVRSEDFQSADHDPEDRAAIEAFQKLRGFAKLKASALLLVYHVAQCILIYAICRVGDRGVECLVLVPSFIFFGWIIKRRWHSKSLLVCTGVTVGMFYVAARALPAFKYSQFLPVIAGLLLAYSLYQVARLTRVEPPEKKKLIQQLQIIGYTKEVAQVLVDYYDTPGTNPKDLEYFISVKMGAG